MELFIPGNVPSLKNSKIKTSKGIFPSKTVVKYLRLHGIKKYSVGKKEVVGCVKRPNTFRQIFEEVGWEKPSHRIVLGFHFIRKSKHKFDFNNATQIIQDLMAAHDFIEDDNMDWLIPIPITSNLKASLNYKKDFFTYDKENPGVYLKKFNL